MVAGRGPSCSFSSILSAALDFRTGYRGAVSLRLVGEPMATSGLTEEMVGEGSDIRPRKFRGCAPSECGEGASVEVYEELEKLCTLARVSVVGESAFDTAGSSGSSIGQRCTRRRKP